MGLIATPWRGHVTNTRDLQIMKTGTTISSKQMYVGLRKSCDADAEDRTIVINKLEKIWVTAYLGK